MRLCKTVACWILLGLLPVTASALGLGNISLQSALNEPFKADIELQSVGKTDLDQLSVSLASVDTFERYGLDRPMFLSGFKFVLDKTASGGDVIRITSTAPVAEPFVSILVDLKWASGRLLREYTVLLDPPLYEETPVQSTVKPAQTAASTPTEASGTVARESQSSVQQPVQQPVISLAPLATVTAAEEVADTAPTESEASDTGVVSVADASAQNEMSSEQLTQGPSEPEAELVAELPADANADADMMAPITQAAEAEAQAVAADMSAAYTTQRGDTLWRISEDRRAANGLTNNQMMLAIFRANPEAFMGNINALKAGSILAMPAANAGAEMSAREATALAIEQHDEWEAKSESVAAEPQPEPEPLPEPETQPEAVQAETPVSDGPRLQLVAPEEDLSTAGQGDDAGAASEGFVDATGTEESIADAIDSERLLQIEDAEFEALQDRQAQEAEADFADASIIVEEIEEPAVSPFADDAELLVDDSGEVAEGQAELDEVSPDASQVVSLPAEDTTSSLLGKLLGSYYVWGGLAFILLLGLFLARRRSSPAAKGSASLARDENAEKRDQILNDFADLPVNDLPVDNLPNDGEPTVALDANDALVQDLATPPAVSEPEADSQIETAVLDYDNIDLLDLGADLDAPATDTTPPPEQLAAEDLDFATQGSQAPQDDEPELPLEQTVSTGAPLNLDQADPIAEAEFHMAYGLYDQAAHLLVGALENEPDTQAYRVKLLEVYFVWENKDAFLAEATKLHATLSGETDADWNKVLILGQQLCPDAELFSGSAASAPTADSMDLDLFAEGGADDGMTEVDFTLGGTEAQNLDEADLDFIVDANEGNAEEDDLAVTLESPTLNLDSPGFDAPTVEVDMTGETVESPILNLPDTTSDMDEVEGMRTEVLDNPAGLDIDLSGLTELPLDAADQLADSSKSVLDIDDTLNQLDNTGEILTPLDMSKTIAEDWPIEVDDPTVQSDTSSLQGLSLSDVEGDTVEQPAMTDGDSELALATTEEATMTEVGTKLDLARAYMDMGDPDGARSILTEVTSEGNDSQQQEARQLLEELGE